MWLPQSPLMSLWVTEGLLLCQLRSQGESVTTPQSNTFKTVAWCYYPLRTHILFQNLCHTECFTYCEPRH